YVGQPIGAGGLRRTTTIEELFAGKDRLLIGRASECDICLPHPSVSRQHALLERLPDGFRLRDLGSINGVSVGGRRIDEPVLIQERERVGIGPFLFALIGDTVYFLDSSQSLRLEARHLEKVVPMRGAEPRKLLDNINLAV